MSARLSDPASPSSDPQNRPSRAGEEPRPPAASLADAIPPGSSQLPDVNGSGRRLVITAGPTHEPIDEVRYIGNRSSGRLGIALADAAARAGWQVTLLLGPTSRTPADSRVRVVRFRTTADLQCLLGEHFPNSDLLIMAAAVADYRPIPAPASAEGKLKRDAAGLTIQMEATPDLLAGCASARRAGQVLVGFALEPRSRMVESARSKLARKAVDYIVANPLETMDAETIEATVVGRDGGIAQTGPAMAKERFGEWLLGVVGRRASAVL